LSQPAKNRVLSLRTGQVHEGRKQSVAEKKTKKAAREEIK